MGQSLIIVRRQLRAWFATVLPPTWVVVVYLVVLLAFEATMHGFISLGFGWADADFQAFERSLHEPRDMLLTFGLGWYGVYRIVAKHPWYRPAYAEWLRFTPWRDGLPLPLGPVKLQVQDGLMLLIVWLWSFDSSRLTTGIIVAVLFAPVIVMHLIPLWTAGSKGRVHAVLIGLAVAVWLRPHSLAGVLCLLACYGVVLSGLSQSLRSAIAGENFAAPDVSAFFGRTEARDGLHIVTLRFPYEQLSPNPKFPHISLRDAVLLSVTLSIWPFALTSLVDEEFLRAWTSAAIGLCGAVLLPTLRVVRYTTQFHPPIGYFGRLVVGPWIIRGYDRVFLPWLYALAPLAATFVILKFNSSLLVWTAPLVCFTGCMIALAAPPTFRHWALTGEHRLAIGKPTAKSEHVEV